MANSIRKEGTGGSSSLTGEGITYSKVINPFKAVCEVKIRKGTYRTEGFACTVLVKRGKTEVAHFVTLSDVARDFNKPTQIYRFSRLHSGQYWLTVDSTTVQTFGPFSFLQVGPNMSSRAASSSGNGDWEVICLAFQAPEGVNTSSLEAYSFVGSERLKLKLEFQGDTKTYKLEASENDMQKLSRAVLGAPIIVENKQIDASNSGRWSVVGVLGLSEEGEFCPYFVSSEILGQLENTPNPSGKPEVDAPEGLHQVLPTGIQEVNDQLMQPEVQSPISQTPENTTTGNPFVEQEVDAPGRLREVSLQEPNDQNVTLTLTLRLARGGLWADGTAFTLARYTNDPVTMVLLFYLVVLPAGVVLHLMFRGSIICILQVYDLNAMRTLWQNYKSGLLKKNLEYVLITEDLRKLARGDEIIMDVILEEKMYRDVCLELILNQKKGDKVYKEESRQPRRLSYPMREKDKSMFQVYQPPFYHQGCGISPSNQQNDQRIDSKANGHSNAKHANSMQSNSEESLLHSASNVGDVNTIETIFPIELDIDSRSSNGATPLMIAARQGTLDSFIALIERKSDHTLKDNNGCTLLHYAANGGNAVIIDKLLSLGLDIDSRNSDGATPLMIEALEYRLDSFSVLMERKSDPTLKDNNGWTLLHYAAAGDNDVIIEELLSRGLDIDSKNSDGATPLMIAAREGRLDVFRVLIGRKADPTLKNNYGKTLLHYAAEGGNDVIIDKLLSLGLDIDSRNSTGETPLMIAAHEGRLDSFSVLIERKADPTLKNNYGFTLLHYAAKGGNEDIIKKLKIGSLRSTTTTSTKTPQNNDIIG